MYKLYKRDSGNFRVYYKHTILKALYCIQNDGAWGKDDYKFYSCTKDGEPSYAVDFQQADDFDVLEYPASNKDATQ